MSDKPISDVLEFARTWAAAGPSVVQHWEVWEARTAVYFGLVEERAAGEMHAIMLLVRSVFFGGPEDVKRAAREASPRAIEIAQGVLGHLPPFAVVLEAETRFRVGDLLSDWSLHLVDGRLVARSEFRAGPESEH